MKRFQIRLRFRKLKYGIRGFWFGVLFERSHYFTKQGMHYEFSIWISVVPHFPVLVIFGWEGELWDGVYFPLKKEDK